jgi:hypothetical protein
MSKVKCSQCDVVMKKNNVKQHVRKRHTLIEGKTQHCLKCDFVSQTRHELKSHRNSKHLAQIAKHQRRLYTMKMKTPNQLLGHLQAVHFNLRKWKCKFCDTSKKNKQDLMIHMKKMHRENVDLNLTRNDRSEIVREEEIVESSETPKHLEKRSQNVEEVPQSAVMDKQCPHCEYVTSRSERLSIHVKVVHKNIRDKNYAQRGESPEKTVKNRDSENNHNKHEVTIMSEIHIEENENAQVDIVTDKPETSNEEMTDGYMSPGDQKLEEMEASEHFKDRDLGAHKCQECNYTAADTMSLLSHVTTVHLKVKLEAIASLQKKSGNDRKMIQNVSAYNFEIGMTGKASYLNTSFHEAVNDAEHCNSFDMQTFPNQGVVMIRDQNCVQSNYATVHQKDLKQHVKAEHYKIGNHKCSQCKYTTAKRHNLVVHVKSVHDNIREHQCTLCDHASARKNNLKNHYKRVHNPQ